jgi:hypothetical protein
MTFADTKQILNESPTAATDYFKGSTTDTLVGHFNAILFTRVTWSISIATWWGKALVPLRRAGQGETENPDESCCQSYRSLEGGFQKNRFLVTPIHGSLTVPGRLRKKYYDTSGIQRSARLGQVRSVWFVLFPDLEKPNTRDRPNRPDRPNKQDRLAALFGILLDFRTHLHF